MTATSATLTKPSSGGTPSAKGISHTIGIAGVKVVQAPDTIRTVLGSCVGVALYDRIAKIGGMTHVILPNSKEGSGDPGKFADTAVEMLVEMLIQNGAERTRLAAKLSGGAAMFGTASNSNLGARNAEAVRSKLAELSIRIVATDLGGTKGRKMQLDPATGDVQVEIIGESPRTI